MDTFTIALIQDLCPVNKGILISLIWHNFFKKGKIHEMFIIVYTVYRAYS